MNKDFRGVFYVILVGFIIFATAILWSTLSRGEDLPPLVPGYGNVRAHIDEPTKNAAIKSEQLLQEAMILSNIGRIPNNYTEILLPMFTEMDALILVAVYTQDEKEFKEECLGRANKIIVEITEIFNNLGSL
jgi:hypothetical protein